MNKILITGANGQLGKKIKDLTAEIKDAEIKDIEFIFTDIDELDITDYQQVEEFTSKHKPQIIVNCAAYTNVEQAEDDICSAYKLNSDAPRNIADISRKNNMKLIHISTDYVFDGTKNMPYSENDLTNPISVYGKSKLDGEKHVLTENPDALIIRTAWLYSEYGKNFALSMLKLAATKDCLNIVYDQVGTPTYAGDLAFAILEICKKFLSEKFWAAGIYHYSNLGVCSWYDFTKAIFKIAELKTSVNPILSCDFPTKAKRPTFSVLNKSKIINTFCINIPHWTDSLNIFYMNLY